VKLTTKAARDAFSKRDLAFSARLYGNLTGTFALSSQDWMGVLHRDSCRAADTGRFFYED
jgi:hypothetical protein